MITVTGLRKVYPIKGGSIVALDEIDLAIPAGAILGIIGESGAGKSTLVRCLAMLDRPTAGRIEINSEVLTDADRSSLRQARRRIGMVFQNVNLLENRTAAANIAYPLEIAGVGRRRRRARVSELLELVGLGGRGGSYPAQLSGGQRQRVGIARALASDPDLLLCDEPTSALDPGTTTEILSLLQDLRDRLDVTIVVITHEVSVVKQICDHVAILEAGRIARAGRLLDVLADSDSGLVEQLMPLPAAVAVSVGDQRTLTLTFATDSTDNAFLSAAIRRFDLDLTVLAGNVEPVQGSSIGRLRIGVPTGTDLPALLEFLAGRGVSAEVH